MASSARRGRRVHADVVTCWTLAGGVRLLPPITLMKSVPTNLITGFLGVGKTTAVIDLLKRKPPGRGGRCLVNEYGEVAIDGALIEGRRPGGRDRQGSRRRVRKPRRGPVPAGRDSLPACSKPQPERLIIETTGLGPPGEAARLAPNELPRPARRAGNDRHRRSDGLRETGDEGGTRSSSIGSRWPTCS